jgi:hypothetical protein
VPRGKSWKTTDPTKTFAIHRLRLDVAERLKRQAKIRHVTVSELATQLLDGGLKMLEAVERRVTKRKLEMREGREE